MENLIYKEINKWTEGNAAEISEQSKRYLMDVVLHLCRVSKKYCFHEPTGNGYYDVECLNKLIRNLNIKELKSCPYCKKPIYFGVHY